MITLESLKLLNNESPELTYEMLACYAFKCNKGDDPWHSSTADSFFVLDNTPNPDVIRNINRILVKLILDNPNNHIKDKLIIIENRLWRAESYNDVCLIINDTIKTII